MRPIIFNDLAGLFFMKTVLLFIYSVVSPSADGFSIDGSSAALPDRIDVENVSN